MPLKAYEEFAQEPLRFPIGNKVYEVPPLGFEDGIKLHRIIDRTESAPETPEELWRIVMGDVFDEMVADKVPFLALQRAGFTAITDFQFGRAAAETVWESGLDPKALIGEASPPTPPDSMPSSDSVAESETPKRASTTGTRSQTTRKRTPAKKRASSSSS